MARGRGECIALGRGGMDSTWPRERWIARCRGGGGWSWIAYGRREVDGTWLVGGMLISHGQGVVVCGIARGRREADGGIVPWDS